MDRVKIGQIGICHEHAAGNMEALRGMPDGYDIVGVVEFAGAISKPDGIDVEALMAHRRDLVAGGRDPRELAKRLAELFPGARIEVLPDYPAEE